MQVVVEGVVWVKGRRGLYRGEDFILMQVFVKVDFWLIFFLFLFGGGFGLIVIDNFGQMSQFFGYDNIYVFVFMISIWNFFGCIFGGYFFEFVVRFVKIFIFIFVYCVL